MKILIAEDEKAMSDALAAVLKHFGYEVDAVYDGLAATEKARENSYSCIIFDIMMPKIDGIEALKRIRDSGDMTPVIMLTAKSEVGDRIMGLDAGADDYLAKPFAMGELLARIRSMTRRMGEFTPTKLKKRRCRAGCGGARTFLHQFRPPVEQGNEAPFLPYDERRENYFYRRAFPLCLE